MIYLFYTKNVIKVTLINHITPIDRYNQIVIAFYLIYYILVNLRFCFFIFVTNLVEYVKYIMSKSLLFSLITILCFLESRAQYGRFYKEIGIMAGPVLFQSDYGERGDFENLIKNSGFSVNGFYYLSFIHNKKTLKENFKLRLDVGFMKSELQHYGKYVDPKKSSLFADQLRGMRGTTQTASLGFQIEFYPWKPDDYGSGYFTPYVSLGSQLNSYSSTASSTLGPLGSALTTPDKYMNGFRNDSGIAGSYSVGFGARYKLALYHALLIDFRYQQYFSDWVDGLNPDGKIYTENKSNDTMVSLSFGYVYYLN